MDDGGFFALAAVCSAVSYHAIRKPSNDLNLALLLASNVMFALTSAFFGPFLILPAAVAVNGTAFAVQLDKRHRLVAVVTAAIALCLPVVLVELGAVASTYEFTDRGLLSLPHALRMPEVPSLVFLCMASVAALVAGSFVVARLRDALAEAESHLYLYTWHLREFVPETARAATDPTGALRARRKRQGRPIPSGG